MTIVSVETIYAREVRPESQHTVNEPQKHHKQPRKPKNNIEVLGQSILPFHYVYFQYHIFLVIGSTIHQQRVSVLKP